MIAAMLLTLLQAAVPPAASHPRRDGEITMPRLIFMPSVSGYYPAVSMARGEEGVTRLYCKLQITGELTECVVRQSCGFAALDAAAFRVAGGARYQPMLVNGRAVVEPVILPVRWALAD